MGVAGRKHGGGLGFDTRAELVERALSDEPAAVDDGEVAAEAFDDFEDVRGEENRGAASDHALEHRLEGAGSDRVDTFEGFVEKKNFGAVDYGGGEGQLFLHTVRVVGDELFALIGELHEIEKLGGAFCGSFAIQAVHAADEVEIFGAGEASKESHSFGYHSDLPFDFERSGGEIQAEDFDPARRGREQTGEHFDRGGFSCAVGAEEAEKLSGSDAEIYILDGDELTEAAREAFRGNCEICHGFPTLAQRWKRSKVRAELVLEAFWQVSRIETSEPLPFFAGYSGVGLVRLIGSRGRWDGARETQVK